MEPSPENRVNVADRLAAVAAERPDTLAVVAYDGKRHQHDLPATHRFVAGTNRSFSCIGLRRLNADADVLARGLVAMGIGPGKRIALLVRPGIEFVTLVFALLRTGATMVLVDAGLGRKNIVRCLASTEPDGFVAIPLGHVMRVLKRKHFPKAKLNVTVGRRWFWGGETLGSLRELGSPDLPSPVGGGIEGGGEAGTRDAPTPNPSPRGGGEPLMHTTADDPAAICFTSGSTGPPKGVLYTHRTFVTQCDSIQRQYDIRPGDVDLACFPLFGLFNVACGVTTVLPEMDFSRPASCDPKKLIAAANQWKVNQAFASPAVWDRVSRHCEETGDSIPTLRKVLSCGAPVPAKVLRRTLACVHPEAEMHTPYGATESLPVATIEAKEILEETAAKTDEGAGVCVGRKFGAIADCGLRNAESVAGEPTTQVVGGIEGFDWRVIKITDDPIATIDETEELPVGEIGELIVKGPQVSREYLTGEPQASAPGANHNAVSKIADGEDVWHRIGDVGYFDAEERFWYCGRKSQRVVTREGTLFTECVEAVANTHRLVRRTALVGLGDPCEQTPVLVVEKESVIADPPYSYREHLESINEKLRSIGCQPIATLQFRSTLPTDIRHNSKIRRETLTREVESRMPVPFED